MPLFGAHLSIAGGFYKAVEAAAALGMETLQVFTHSPSQWSVVPATSTVQKPRRTGKTGARGGGRWRVKELSDDEVARFRAAVAASGIQCPSAHDSYLINLASPDRALWRRSVAAFAGELERAERLGIAYLVTHPGAHTTSTERAGLRAVARALDEVHQQVGRLQVRTLLETTAGQGTSLGWKFEHLAAILELVQAPERLGVCFDTCHVFAAGYSLSGPREYAATMQELDRTVGLDQVRAFHLNDSQREQGSRVDRHAHIGRGCLGLAPFRLLLRDQRFAGLPMYLETPKETIAGEAMDAVNLRTLRALAGRPAGRAG